MSRTKRIQNFVNGLLLIIGGLLLAIVPDAGYIVIDLALSAVFIAMGIKFLIYYIDIARFSVDGVASFYKAIVFIDLGFFAITIADMPKHYVMIYIMIGFAAAAVLDIIDAVNLKKIQSPAWKARLAQGIICVLLPLVSLILFTDSELMFIAYGASIIYRGIGKTVAAFRRRAIVYVGE